MHKVLIVDDEPMIRETLALFLDKKYKVFLAEDGDVALESVKENNPDFIITDINMPNMNGDVFAAKVFEYNPKIPVLVISGLDTNKEKAYTKNVVQFLQKPFKVKSITDIIQEHLNTISLVNS